MRITGLTKNTPKKFLLDAGAFFKNYDLTKSYADNAANLIGATQGGGSFSAIPTVRKREVDGGKGNVIGLQTIDEWVVTMVTKVKEVTAENLQLALGAGDVEAATEAGVTGSTKVTGRADIEDTDYLDNITWAGRLSGSNTPVIIVIQNALSLNGLTLTVADKNEANIPVTVTGHYSLEDLETPPFAIYYPSLA